ncbi:MAG: STAS domain-containing protein [Chlorobiaceae bacterium]
MIFHLDTSSEKAIGIAELQGRIDANNCNDLKKSFSQWLQYSSNIVFDCSGLEFIDSSGLGAIVDCLRKALEAHGDLRLSGLGPKVSLIFEITKAKKLFSMYPDSPSAVASFSLLGSV